MTPKNPNQKIKLKHNYTSELELKSLLIRIKNERANIGTTKNNTKINKYIDWHTKINNKKYKYPTKRNIVKTHVKENIVTLSEDTRVDEKSYERFGEIILLMIKNILKKPQFSGYTYKDDFYSDAVYKILKYLHNFDHTKNSKITNQPVNAFAYISTIIHNSIIFILNQKKKENELVKKQVEMEKLNHNYEYEYTSYHIDTCDKHAQGMMDSNDELGEITQKIHITKIDGDLYNTVNKMNISVDDKDKITIIYPSDYRIQFDEYNMLKDLLKGKISIIRDEEQEWELLSVRLKT